ncbi:MAG: hypothetical protein IH585_12280 [Anaerolineaceae bacterium]|nr:hypothetical protein [Anaerolineaceae bacterium]
MKKNKQWKLVSIPFVLIFIINIACNLPGYALAREELETGLRMVTEETWQEELSQINQEIDENFIGKNNYSVSPSKDVKNDSKCDQGHPSEKKVTTFNTIQRGGEETWESNELVIKEEGKNYIYHQALDLKPNIYCRQTENFMVECIFLSNNGYSIRVYEESYNGSYLPYVLDDMKPCHELNYNLEGAAEQNLSIDLELRLTEVPGKWNIDQCNAISDINKNQTEFTEGKNYDEDGGYLEYTFCEYNTVFRNTGGLPISIIYYHYRYDENVDGSEWVKVSARQPGEQYSSYDFVDKYKSNDYITASMVNRYAAIYDVPNCSWIKEGGIHYDIITIIEENTPPCTVISPYEGRDFLSFPDYTESLIKD